MSKEWFHDWFDENYLLLYCHRDLADAMLQIDLLIDKIKPGKKDRILDLGCGEGRHVSLLEQKGFNVTGLDLSVSLLESGKQKHPDLRLLQGDMRNIPGKFNIILSLFTSFGYFKKDSENIAVIQGVYRSLEKRGHFWLDFLNPEYLKNNIVSENTFSAGDDCEVTENRKILCDRVVKDITIRKGGKEKKYMESVRLFSKEDLLTIFCKSGFDIKNIYGDYKGNAWSPESIRTIIHSYKTDT